jgi:UDP-3-O-[3-hydroxymyristoyl] glucosamine N-acyltransferase
MLKKIALKEIIDFLGSNVICVFGNIENVYVNNLRPSEKVDKDTLDWINVTNCNKQSTAEKTSAKTIITDPSVLYSEIMKQQGKVLIHVSDPKLSIAMAGNAFFSDKPVSEIHPTAIIHPEAKIGVNVHLGPNIYIGKSEIGDRTILLGNNYVDDNVKIGSDVFIQAGVVIGNEGHNFIRDKNNHCIKFPHIGGVIVEDNVEIGGNTFISRGVLSDTIIKKGTKIAQLVYIGANVRIGVHCAIRPNVMISGSAVIGDYVILAPSSTIREHRIVADKAFIGMGAVVTKNVPVGETWIGNPANKMNK